VLCCDEAQGTPATPILTSDGVFSAALLKSALDLTD